VPSYRTGRVTGSLAERPGLHRVAIEFDPLLPADHPAAKVDRAYALTAVSGPVEVGHRVLLNTTAVELGLGTGGWHVVVADLDAPAWSTPGGGHVLKLRYTGMQVDNGVAEELDGTAERRDLGGMPVVVGTVHSQVAGVVAAAHASPGRRRPRVAYVMTDGGALPLVLSDLVERLRSAGLVDVTVTAGHAFGGDLEAVNVASALDLARHRAGADIAVVVMGPGVVGTGTRLGTTALEAAPILDTVAALGGRPLFCARFSSGDERPRHRGVSHHAATVLDLVRSRVEVPVPSYLVDAFDAGSAARHEIVAIDPPDLAATFADHDLDVTTMGRGIAEEPEFFAVCGSCGIYAARAVEP
jgi:hypothetical protein